MIKTLWLDIIIMYYQIYYMILTAFTLVEVESYEKGYLLLCYLANHEFKTGKKSSNREFNVIEALTP
jgi:hypothetical protein